MKALFVSDVNQELLLDPDAPFWGGVTATPVALQGTPLAMQPSAAIRNTWQNRPIGVTAQVAVRAVHNGSVLAFHLDWLDPRHDVDHGDNTRWPDAAAVALPLHPDAPLLSMGAPGAPVTAWYWRADSGEAGMQVVAEGPGSSRIVDRAQVRVAARWRDGGWRVVITRALRVDGATDVMQLESGSATRFGIAVWEGGSQERGGLKAFSGDWLPLELAAGAN